MNNPSTFPNNTLCVFNNGNTAIVVDDNCYVVKNWNGSEWKSSAHVFPEAVRHILKLDATPNNELFKNKNTIYRTH